VFHGVEQQLAQLPVGMAPVRIEAAYWYLECIVQNLDSITFADAGTGMIWARAYASPCFVIAEKTPNGTGNLYTRV